MVDNIDEDEKLIGTIFLSGQKREAWLVTEDGLYEILMQSRKLNTLTDADLSSDEESDGPTGSAEKEFPEDQENYTLA